MKTWLKTSAVTLVCLSSAAWSGLGLVYQSNLNFPLYKNEAYWGGSKQTELASFIDGGRRVLRAQAKIAERSHETETKRVFHAKSHGCYTGKLKLLRDRPMDHGHETYVGMFDPSVQDEYDVVVRFSNGLGSEQDDKLPDVRGAAIKVFDVRNSDTGKPQTVDLLMTNSQSPFGKDFLEFAKFMDFVADFGPTVGGLIFSSHPRAEFSLLKTAGLPVLSDFKIKSLATLRYWSGHPYLLGKDKAMKFNIAPTEFFEASTAQLQKANDPDFLKNDLIARLKRRPVKFVFSLQLEKSLRQTPIEDNLVEWTEKVSPSIPVAELVLDQQNGAIDLQECKDLRFTPGHYVPGHRPLSNMGRGRLFGYEASQIGRGAPPLEPTVQSVREWRDKSLQSGGTSQ